MTDANLILGRIGAASFLGGEMRLDEAAARTALRERVAAPLGFHADADLDEVAHGVLTLGSARMADAIRRVTIERGLDPRDFALFAFGGGGPLHAATLARELSIPEVIIPPEPGVFSALGMLLADARVDETQTFLRPLDAEAVADMTREFEALEARMREALAREVGGGEVLFERQAHMRFRGQRHALRAPIGPHADIDVIRANFEEHYRRRYGFVAPGSPIEFVGLVLTATVAIERPDLASLRPASSGGAAQPVGARGVYFDAQVGRVDTPVWRRADLPEGHAIAGPAVIEEYGSTTVVAPNDRLVVGAFGELRILIDGAVS